MIVTEKELKNGSVQLRIIKKRDGDKAFPPYELLTVMEPLSDDTCELTGLDKPISGKQLKAFFKSCANRGFKFCRISRANSDGTDLKIKEYEL
jgi:hypothetical protein